MSKFLYIFGTAVFAGCFLFFVMNFVGEYSETTLIISVLGMLNASIAIGVGELLTKAKGLSVEQYRNPME